MIVRFCLGFMSVWFLCEYLILYSLCGEWFVFGRFYWAVFLCGVNEVSHDL